MPSNDAILEEARERAQVGTTYWQHNFDAAAEDLRFLFGDQWPSEIEQAREAEGRPCLTINKLPQYVDQVLGDQRENKRTGINIHPIDGESAKITNVKATYDYSLSEVYESLIRNIERNSRANVHYERAFQHAVESGFGWLRVIPQYAGEGTFDQDLVIKSILNRFAVTMDPNCHEPDYADADWCFISERMQRDEFKRKYPKARTGDIAAEHRMNWWMDEDTVRVAEYFYRETTERKLWLLSDGRTVWADEQAQDELRAMDIAVVRERMVDAHVVKWMLITAYDVLEGPQDVASTTIPVIPVLGKEMSLGDKTYYRGLIRYAHDPQRMANYWMSAATERVALAPKAQWTAPAEAIEGYEQEWANANRSSNATLRYNTLPTGDKPTREPPPGMPNAEIQLAMSATDELKQTIGMYDPALGAESQEVSGRAIVARQGQADRGNTEFSDNLNRAIQRIGRVLVEMIPRVYDAERVLRVRSTLDIEDWVRVNQTIIDDESGEQVQINDITVGKFDVTVTSGPSHKTQRMEAADQLIQFVSAIPQAGPVVMDMIAEHMDWPESQTLARRLKHLLPPGILSEETKQELGIQPPQPTPEQRADMMKARADMAQAQATRVKAQSEVVQAKAEAQGEIAETAGDIASSKASPELIQQVRELVAEALLEYQQETGNATAQQGNATGRQAGAGNRGRGAGTGGRNPNA